MLERLDGRIEIAGGLWVLLVTWAAFPLARLPRALNSLRVVIGLAGILTVVPALAVLGTRFQLGEMVWGTWLGIAWLRGSQSGAARTVRACFGQSDGLRAAARRRLSSDVKSWKLRGQV